MFASTYTFETSFNKEYNSWFSECQFSGPFMRCHLFTYVNSVLEVNLDVFSKYLKHCTYLCYGFFGMSSFQNSVITQQ